MECRLIPLPGSIKMIFLPLLPELYQKKPVQTGVQIKFSLKIFIISDFSENTTCHTKNQGVSN